MPQNNRPPPTPVGQRVAETALGLHDDAWEALGRYAAPKGSTTGAWIKGVSGAPTTIYNAARFFSAKPEDRARIGFGLAGGYVGTGLGGAAGGAVTGGLGSFAGGMAGGAFGSEAGERIYDENKAVIDRGIATAVRLFDEQAAREARRMRDHPQAFYPG